MSQRRAIFLRVSEEDYKYAHGLKELLCLNSFGELWRIMNSVFWRVLYNVMRGRLIVAVDEKGKVVQQLVFREIEQVRGISKEKLPEELRKHFPLVQ